MYFKYGSKNSKNILSAKLKSWDLQENFGTGLELLELLEAEKLTFLKLQNVSKVPGTVLRIQNACLD